MGNVAAQIPSDEIAGRVVRGVCGGGQLFALAAEEDHQIGDATVVDVRVGVEEHPANMVGVGPEIGFHVFVDFLLKIDSHGAVDADDFVGADSGVGGNVATGVRNAYVGGVMS